MRTSLAIKSLTGLSAMFVAAAMTVPAHAYEEGAVAGGGSITGKVVFNGTPGTRKVIPTKDLDVCGGPYEETLIQVGPDKSVYNAVVYLADIAKGKAWPAQAKPPEIDNVKCKFEPHIQVIRAGKLDVVNSDPMLHNTHGYYGRRTAFNLALPNKGQRIPVELTRAGQVRIDCDAHGWMEAMDLRGRQSLLRPHQRRRQIYHPRGSGRHLQAGGGPPLYRAGRAVRDRRGGETE